MVAAYVTPDRAQYSKLNFSSIYFLRSSDPTALIETAAVLIDPSCLLNVTSHAAFQAFLGFAPNQTCGPPRHASSGGPDSSFEEPAA